MSDESIGNNTQGPGAGGVSGQYGPYVPGSPSGPAITPFLYDSLSLSELGTDQSNNMADPMNPRLQKPTYADIVMQFQLGMSQIITNLLTQWNKSLHEEADRIETELKSPKYQVWVQQHTANYIAQEDLKAGRDLAVPVKDAYHQEVALVTGTMYDRDKYAALTERYNQVSGLSSLLSLSIQNIDAGATGLSRNSSSPDLAGVSHPMNMAATLAIGAGFISSFAQVPDVSSTNQVEVKSIQDAWNNVNMVNDQITQTGGWFSAMWSIGLVYQLSAQNISELGAGGRGKPNQNLEFAKDYAQTLVNSLDGNGFNLSLMALLTPMLEKSPETQAKQNPEFLAIKGKVVLLALALALVYKLELKSKNPDALMDEAFFAAMLKGSVDFSRGDTFETAELKRQLVAYFQFNLNQLPESERVKVVEGILAYISKSEDSDEPGVEGLLDQQAAFSDIFAGGSQGMVDKTPV